MLAHGITVDVRHGLRGRDAREEDAAALDAAQRAERASDAGLYEAIAARSTDERMVDFGPLFNPAACSRRRPMTSAAMARGGDDGRATTATCAVARRASAPTRRC